MEARAEGLTEGVRLLTAAKRVLAAAKKLDEEEAAALRRVADGLVERGLGLVIEGAKQLEATLRKQGSPPPPDQAAGK